MEKPLEVNPAKGVDDATVHANIEQLERVCSEILASIDSQRELITPAFRRMCNFVRKAVEEALDSPVTAAADAALMRADEAAAAASPVRPSPSVGFGPSATYLTPALKVLSSFFFLRYAVPGREVSDMRCITSAALILEATLGRGACGPGQRLRARKSTAWSPPTGRCRRHSRRRWCTSPRCSPASATACRTGKRNCT